MGGHAVSRPVVVDVTSDQTTAMLVTAIKQGFDVVLANKKPIADSWESYEHLMQTAAACRRTIKYEATVGAGLPIIDTFHKLDETGDRVRRIEGSVSGTLMFVLSEVSAGRAFSEAVREAMARGYAEPDPREDLSGRDAMRKALILARLLGYRGGPPAAEDLMPPAFRSLPVATFLERLPELDESFRTRIQDGSGARPNAALRGERHTPACDLWTGGGAVIQPVWCGQRHSQYGDLSFRSLSPRTARDQRTGRRRRRHRRGPAQRSVDPRGERRRVGALAG